MSKNINCENCKHAGKMLISDTIQDGMSFTKSNECELGYEIEVGSLFGCNGKRFESKKK